LAKYGRYALLGACGYLQTDETGWQYCGAYEQRPEVCQEFEMGGEKCLNLRTTHGVPVPNPVLRRLMTEET
jgi:Fe-S-cluster containining protein